MYPARYRSGYFFQNTHSNCLLKNKSTINISVPSLLNKTFYLCSLIAWVLGPWSDCSAVVCGEGSRTRTRRCRRKSDAPGSPDLDPSECGGGPTELQTGCNLGPCHRWGEWGQWTDCSTSCGVGTRSMSRICEDIRVRFEDM